MANQTPFRYRWYARGDINGFFALAIDNIALLVGMSGILIGVFHLPPDMVLGSLCALFWLADRRGEAHAY